MLCINIFSVTSWSIGIKLHRKHHLNVLTIIPSICVDPCRILVSMATERIKLKTFSSPKPVGQFSFNFVGLFLRYVTLFQIPSNHVVWAKNVATRGQQAILPYSENFKNLLLISILLISKLFCRNVSLVTLKQIFFKPCWLVGKQGHRGAGPFCLIYGYSENLKILFLQKNVVDFQIIV